MIGAPALQSRATTLEAVRVVLEQVLAPRPPLEPA
jgi:hypothetical protein